METFSIISLEANFKAQYKVHFKQTLRAARSRLLPGLKNIFMVTGLRELIMKLILVERVIETENAPLNFKTELV